MAINQNSAFQRVYFDLPTEVAVKMDERVKVLGVSKKKYLADLVTQDVSNSSNQPATKKRGAK